MPRPQFLAATSLATVLCGFVLAQSPTPANHNFPVQGPRPGQMKFVQVFSKLNFVRPLFLTHAPDNSDRIFVVEKDGVISVFPNRDDVGSRSIFLDLRSVVQRSSEEGLLGMAFDPDYASNGYFYVHYSRWNNGNESRISRFRVSSNDPDQADRNSEFVLMDVPQPYPNHNAGMLEFGPDKMLYIGMGDGGSGGDPHNHGQNRQTLLGNILRIDPHKRTGNLNYGIPNDNPFVGAGNGIREEIWAYGMRNPWRFSFDPVDGRLFCADVGQSSREEVSRITKGSNCGWKIREGDRDYANPQKLPPSMFNEPLVAYDRSKAISITGGYVYRGQRLPELKGAFIHGDYVTGNVWALVEQNGKLVSNTLIGNFGNVSGNLASFGVDQNQELYLISLNGDIWKMERTTTQPPKFPVKLSTTGLFSDVRSLTPASGVYPYEINHPFWSDHAEKSRFLAYSGTQIGFRPTGAWDFSQGTVLVKHFEMEMRVDDPTSRRRLETRVLVHEQDGWAGYTYRWNSAQDDADLVPLDGANETLTIRDRTGNRIVRTQDWRYPGRGECLQCHTNASGRVISARTRQMNKRITVNNQQVEQLEEWDRIGMFSSSIGAASQYGRFTPREDLTASVDVHARTWLDVNCAMCHTPGGPTPSDIDLRYDTPLTQTKAFDADPKFGGLGLRLPKIMKPHEHADSVLWERIRRVGVGRMPQIGSNVADAYAVDLLRTWIGSPVELYGSSCGGGAATPRLDVVAGGEARVGGTNRMELTNLPTDEGAVLFFGFDNKVWGRATLPLPLDAAGMIGCTLYVPGDVLYPVLVSGGKASWNVPIPNHARLIGAHYHLQGIAIATGSNLFGAITTNAARVNVVGP